MSEIRIGPLVFEYDPQTRYLGIGNGEELMGTAEVDEKTWEGFSNDAGNLPPSNPRVDKRVGEARERLATALGVFRLYMDSPMDQEVKERDKGIELDMERALDRLDRVLQGEDYIERWEVLRDSSHGAVHFDSPSPAALPADVQADP